MSDIEKTTHINFTFEGENADEVDFYNIFSEIPGLIVKRGNVNTYYTEKRVEKTTVDKVTKK